MTTGSANEGILDYTRIRRSFRIAGGAVDRQKSIADTDANDAKTKRVKILIDRYRQNYDKLYEVYSQ
jgi:hypothetical protein